MTAFIVRGESPSRYEEYTVPQVVVVANTSLPENLIEDWREVCRGFATYLGEPVTFLVTADDGMAQLDSFLEQTPAEFMVEALDGNAAPAVTNGVSKAPMSSAEFIWKDDGRPDWAAMWTGFCDLALYGGPPHRGEDTALKAVDPGDFGLPANTDWDAIAEIRRGIWETTGLFAEPAEPGWIAVTCHSRKMAAWLCATTILENVEAKFEDERLLLPAAAHFGLKNEVKSVITVVAKVNHYWQAHIAGTEVE